MSADNPGRILKKQKRRRHVITAIGFGLAGGGGYWYATGQIPGSESVLDSAPGVDSALNQHINDVHWRSDSVVIDFAEDHDADGFAILHEHNTDFGDNIIAGEIPEFGGELLLPFIDEVREEWARFPSPTFNVRLYDGDFSAWDSQVAFNWPHEEKPIKVSFTVPEEKRPST